MIGIDTNVLIRYITQDDEVQAKIASDYIESNCTLNNPGYINQIVLCEIIWVLKRAYRYNKQIIIDIIRQLLQTGELMVDNSENVWLALEAYEEGSADFSDYLIALSNKNAGCEKTITFDKNAAYFSLFDQINS